MALPDGHLDQDEAPACRAEYAEFCLTDAQMDRAGCRKGARGGQGVKEEAQARCLVSGAARVSGMEGDLCASCGAS